MNCTIPPNAFSSVTVHDLIFFKDGGSYAQTFHRGIIKPGEQLSMKSDYCTRPEGIPTRPISTLPPPGNQHLELSLGERLGDGRVGSVHAVDILEPGLASVLPPLVIKVSRRKRFGNLAQEAWFYEELEQLQGISVPRCYGLFQVRLKDGQCVATWDSKEYEDQDESDDENGPEYEYDDKNGSEYEPDPNLSELEREESKRIEQQLKEDAARFKAIDKEYERQINEVPGEGLILTILLLERLGDCIPIPIQEPIDSIRADVFEIFNDLARLGLEPLDIRWSNILSVNNESTTSLPGAICPNHDHAHRWRLVDFDLCRKTDGTTEFIVNCTGSWLGRLFRGLEDGCVIEPWD